MGNHVHLLIKECIEDTSVSLKRLGVGYVQWYNKKYQRSGHLFQDRFLNEPVEDDEYLLTVSRYIHMNTVKLKWLKDLRIGNGVVEERIFTLIDQMVYLRE